MLDISLSGAAFRFHTASGMKGQLGLRALAADHRDVLDQ
jgi:hypothetical protein